MVMVSDPSITSSRTICRLGDLCSHRVYRGCGDDCRSQQSDTVIMIETSDVHEPGKSRGVLGIRFGFSS